MYEHIFEQVHQSEINGALELSVFAEQDPTLLLALATWIEQSANKRPLAEIRWTWRTPEDEVTTWTPTPAEMEAALADLADRLDSMTNPVGVRTSTISAA